MAGGSLVTKIGKAFGELDKLGLVAGAGAQAAIHGAQAAGLRADRRHGAGEPRSGEAGEDSRPASRSRWRSATRPTASTRAQTIIGSGGWAAKPDDEEIVAAMRLLAETEGIFTETAGGVTLAAAIKLIAGGQIGKDDGRWSSASPATA